MAIRIEDLFFDPTPNGLINQRYVGTMLRLIESTDMSQAEKDEFINIVLAVAIKLLATWKHFNRYETTEDELIERATAGESLENQPVQRLHYSQDLFLEMDEFLVQFKSTLDYLVKLPVPLVGRSWNLRTFGKRGESVRRALKKTLPTRFKQTAITIEENVLALHSGWLGTAIEARDRLNHFLEGGADFERILVVKTVKDGVEKIEVPLWNNEQTARQVLEIIFYNLVRLVEDFFRRISNNPIEPESDIGSYTG